MVDIEYKVDLLWERVIKYNSYTCMGSDIKFDKIADMVIGENEWHMRNEALLTIKSIGKLLSPKDKLEIIKASGFTEVEIYNYLKGSL